MVKFFKVKHVDVIINRERHINRRVAFYNLYYENMVPFSIKFHRGRLSASTISKSHTSGAWSENLTCGI